MLPVNELLVGLHLLLLLAFIGVTSMLMLVTVLNRVRVRDVLLSWPNGRFFGLPVWSTLFLAVVLGFLGGAVLQDQIIYPMIFVGYLMGGTFWFAASVIMSSVHVTPHGLILNVNRNGRALAWSQVVDFFEYGDEHEGGIVFFYIDRDGRRRRLELQVPSAYRKRFARLASDKLNARFESPAEQLAGPRALED
ncbi:MAG TPA: hypothetical protein VF190_12870 [Rhodothermales bacterium]